jgi:hypothetical protein
VLRLVVDERVFAFVLCTLMITPMCHSVCHIKYLLISMCLSKNESSGERLLFISHQGMQKAQAFHN